VKDPVFEAGLGVADHGVVHEVDPGLIDEPFALGALQRGDAALAHRSGPSLEPLDHGLDIQVLGHRRRG
jgi:hypothetical protein